MSITRFAIKRQHLIKDHLLQGIHNYVTQGDRETNRETDTERHRHRETQRQTEDTEADRGRQRQTEAGSETARQRNRGGRQSMLAYKVQGSK